MDTFAHFIWAWFYAAFFNLHSKLKIKVWLTSIFSVLPDVVSFGPILIFGIFNWFFGSGFNFHAEPAIRDTLPLFKITGLLYDVSHSLIIFLIVFICCWIIFKKPIFELTGWLLHILLDIPTHSYKFYPTPFLWPVSAYTFNGLAWSEKWFMIFNYTCIFLVWFFWYRKLKH